MQMTIILKYFNTETGCIKEHSVGFLAIQEENAAISTDTY
jgi:hypothetical protein